MKLRNRQRCPIHGKWTCCGREDTPRERSQRHKYIEPGVRLLPDGRQLRSDSAMRRLVDQKIREQNKLCGICHEPMEDYREVVGAHKRCKGMGGAFRDDSPQNIVAAHSICNGKTGSRRIA